MIWSKTNETIEYTVDGLPQFDLQSITERNDKLDNANAETQGAESTLETLLYLLIHKIRLYLDLSWCSA